MFSITLVNIDSYQAAPIPELDVTFSEFRGSEIRKVPIIRIFGSTSTGKKTCLHAHGAFPYIYVPCTVLENTDSYAYQLAASIDSALNTSFGSTASTNQHVYRIERVSGIPFYGYHEKEHSFFKIYFYNPAIIKRTADLLQNGAILNQNFQPYEAHIPYILQFMIDNNLYGMNVINLNSIKYRHSSQTFITDNNQDKASSNLLDSQAYLPISVARQSMCELEVDAHVSDILNRQSVEKLELSPGLAAIWDEEKARRAEAGLEDAKSQLLYPKMPNENILPPTTNDIHQEERLLKRLEAISQTNETIISSTNASSYPIEVEDNEHFLNASHVLHHDETFTSKEGVEKRIFNNKKSSRSGSISEANQSQSHLMDTSILDADDMQLVEILANLAEDSQVRSNVDDDSVLGSQYSAYNLAKNDQEEEEEVEDLNITSLDLGSLSPWESVHKRSNQCVGVPETMHDENKQESVEDTNIIDQSWKDVTLVDLPQFDGVYDLSGNTLKYKREIINSSNNVTFTVAQHSSTDIKHMPFINASKEHTYVVCNLHRNLHLMDIIEYIVNNTKGRHLRKQLYNFVNKCHFHIFVKTSKNLQCISMYNLNTDTSVTTKKMHRLQNNKKIVHNKKIKEELYVTQYQLRLDHRDLDVYDMDEINASENFEDIKEYYITNYIENNYIYERDPKLHFQQEVFLNNDRCLNHNPHNLSLKSAILNVDGATATDSSDSEFEADITIDKQEKRICVYKSCKKNAPQSTVQITPKKRRLDFNDSHHESPDKRKNMGTRTPRRPYDSSKVLRSPQCSPGNYSPLDITVVSPKTSKSPIRQCESPKSKQNVPFDVPFTSTTPRHKTDLLRVNLLREQRITNLLNSDLENDVADDLEKSINIIDTIQNTKDSSPIKTSETRGVHELIQRRENNEDSLIKGNEKIRKRLHFFNYDDVENASTELDHRKSQSENSIAFGRLIDQAHADATISLSSNENSEDTEKTNDMSPDREYASNIHKLASESTKLYEIIPETDLEDDDVLSTTFTQHVNQKMENDSQSLSLERSSCQSAKDVLITITTKYKPPSPDRILESMTLYGIPKYRWKKPFFSNKLDLAKQKESLNANALNFDVAAFKSSLDEITGIKLWRRMKVNEFYPSGSSIKTCHLKRALAGYNLLTIKPLIAPPSSKDVKDWIRARKYLSRKNCNVKSHKEDQEKALNMKNICDNPSVDIMDVNDKPQPGTSSNHSISNNLNLAGTASLMVQQDILSGVPDGSRKLDRIQNSNDSRSSQVSANSLNPSLQKALENSSLYKQNKTEQLGISYGQIEYSSKGSYGNASSENLKNVRVLTVQRYLTLLSLEVHVITRENLLPDPQYDPIAALFYAIYNDISTDTNEEIEHGAIIVNPYAVSTRLNKIHSSSAMCPMLYVATEQDALNGLVSLIEQHNPDILVGWEVEMLSWGYVFHRASHLALNGFPLRISKVPYMQIPSKSDAHVFEKDDIGEIKVPGRNILDVWRIMRHEAALLSYTFENVMHHVLHERIPCPSFKTLSTWWKQESMVVKCRVIRHYVIRVIGTLKILNHLDIVGRTCEHARLFGIQFYEVFSRGSQFRVESMMLRLTKPFNYIPISPSVSQRAKMRAPECLPLIMEPESEFYTDPLIVLDFQSLYPSMIIAYNYCFSTCLGRIEHIGQNGPFDFGAANLRIGKNTALKLKDKINFSPCGVAFVKKEVRQGILPRMLTEILNTRLMVKESMKLYPAENRTLQRALHSQQLGLKLIANVTYGYTSANFSGRMPCIEIGDSIVSKGRETLERAIKLVESTPKWGGRVIYGDTDSLFVLLPGKSREEAFTIGEEIANAVTAINPPPVKLKFEKVLHPSILQTKKRYCGYMYETRDQEKPEFLAKGIETVRRDGCPAVAKMLEKALKILFDTKDLSLVKLYVTRQFDKIFHRRVSIQELTFAKEFRGMHGYKANACVPALELTRRLIKKDPRAVPRVSERVRYIIVAGAPNQALIHCVRTPKEVISDTALIPNSVYYITKVIIPPLNRCFNLLGIDVNTWYKEMSHRHSFDNFAHLGADNPKSTIRQFFASVMCITCGEQTNKEVCAECLSQPNRTIFVLLEKIRQLERTYQQIANICHSCIGRLSDIECVSLDCPILYRITQARNELAQVSYMNNIIYGNNSSGIKGVNAVVEWY